MVERLNLLESVFDKKTVKILEELLNIKNIFYLRDLSKKTGVSLATTYRIIQKLVKLGIVEKENIGKFTQYKVKRNERYNEIYSLVFGEEIDPIRLLKDKITSEYGSSFRIFNTDDKLFLISDKIKEINNIIKEIENKTGNKLNILKITQEQFNQMKEIGLIKDGKFL